MRSHRCLQSDVCGVCTSVSSGGAASPHHHLRWRTAHHLQGCAVPPSLGHQWRARLWTYHRWRAVSDGGNLGCQKVGICQRNIWCKCLMSLHLVAQHLFIYCTKYTTSIKTNIVDSTTYIIDNFKYIRYLFIIICFQICNVSVTVLLSLMCMSIKLYCFFTPVLVERLFYNNVK